MLQERDSEIAQMEKDLAFLTARQMASRTVLIKRKSTKENDNA